MAAYFLDTSAIVKRYIAEIGSAWIRGLADPAASHELYLARITELEMTSALIRRLRTPGGVAAAMAVLSQFRRHLAAQYAVHQISSSLIGDAMAVAEAHALRAYDAMQLAAALELRRLRAANGLPPIIMITADQELLSASRNAGLKVDDPNVHP